MAVLQKIIRMLDLREKRRKLSEYKSAKQQRKHTERNVARDCYVFRVMEDQTHGG